MTRSNRRRSSQRGPTLEGLAGGTLALIPAYFFMESLFGVQPHPLHWVGAGIGASVGYGAGALIAAYKERRFPFAQPHPLRPPGASRDHARRSGANRTATPTARPDAIRRQQVAGAGRTGLRVDGEEQQATEREKRHGLPVSAQPQPKQNNRER